MADIEPAAVLETERRRRRRRRIIGVILMALGIAAACLAGLCGLVFLPIAAAPALLLSGPVIAGGAALAWGGSRLRRSGREGLSASEADQVVRRFD